MGIRVAESTVVAGRQLCLASEIERAANQRGFDLTRCDDLVAAKTRTYLGEAGGRVILHNGASWLLFDAGSLSNFIVPASAAGF
jgi:hypothetical protein